MNFDWEALLYLGWLYLRIIPSAQNGSGFAHLHSPSHHKFTRHINESLFMMGDDLAIDLEGRPREERERVYGSNDEPS